MQKISLLEMDYTKLFEKIEQVGNAAIISEGAKKSRASLHGFLQQIIIP